MFYNYVWFYQLGFCLCCFLKSLQDKFYKINIFVMQNVYTIESYWKNTHARGKTYF